MKWTDVYDIAIELAERYPDANPQYVNFVDLHDWVCQLDEFDDDHDRGGEKVLEAIQAAWIEEIAE
ncbi:MAG: Fe-S assembly protein IscX [Gammaproteobacteria bacterium]|nr:Fe-S assembly protein IscX [Gammaproteobacteria bacterium]|tara:strand:- start:603 stop:800 length:198 start_codon:yes stop_codon:yes gene_type:complete